MNDYSAAVQDKLIILEKFNKFSVAQLARFATVIDHMFEQISLAELAGVEIPELIKDHICLGIMLGYQQLSFE